MTEDTNGTSRTTAWQSVDVGKFRSVRWPGRRESNASSVNMPYTWIQQSVSLRSASISLINWPVQTSKATEKKIIPRMHESIALVSELPRTPRHIGVFKSEPHNQVPCCRSTMGEPASRLDNWKLILVYHVACQTTCLMKSCRNFPALGQT